MAKVIIREDQIRSERVAALMTPILKADLVKIAAVHRTSVNTIINNAIKKYLEDHRNDIDRYNIFFGEE